MQDHANIRSVHVGADGDFASAIRQQHVEYAAEANSLLSRVGAIGQGELMIEMVRLRHSIVEACSNERLSLPEPDIIVLNLALAAFMSAMSVHIAEEAFPPILVKMVKVAENSFVGAAGAHRRRLAALGKSVREIPPEAEHGLDLIIERRRADW